MWPMLIPLLATAGSSILSSVIANKGAMDRQNAMNAYNSPVQQMARYSAAGLNPNLIYGSGGSAGLQGSPTQFYTPDVDPVKIWSASVAATESRQRNELNRARTQAENLRTAYDNLTRDAKIPYLKDNAMYQSTLMHKSIQNVASDIQNKWSQHDLLVKQLDNLGIDSKIKNQILNERTYYNKLRDYGVEKGDNPLYRMGALMFHKYSGAVNQKLHRLIGQ